MALIRYFTVSLAAALGASTAGCFWVTTKAEGNKIRKEARSVEARVATLEEGIDAKMKKLQAVLDEATELLARNSADIGNQVSGLEADMRQLRGLINEAHRNSEAVRRDLAALQKYGDLLATLELKLKDFDQRLSAVEQKTAQPSAETAGELYDQAMGNFKAGNYDAARKYFKLLVVRFPGHGRADDAQYHRGESYYKEKNYDAAIGEFQKVWDKFEKSPLADDAMFRAGEAAEALKKCTEARAYYGLLRRTHPDSSLAKKALQRDKVLKKNAKKKKHCTS